jgi:hypothetical protein
MAEVPPSGWLGRAGGQVSGAGDEDVGSVEALLVGVKRSGLKRLWAGGGLGGVWHLLGCLLLAGIELCCYILLYPIAV